MSRRQDKNVTHFVKNVNNLEFGYYITIVLNRMISMSYGHTEDTDCNESRIL